MEMRCLKENVLMDWRVGSGQSQAVVEGEMTLPGGLREEAHVLYTGGMAVINSAEAMQDRLVLSGRVVFHALYTQGDPDRIQSIEASADFTHTMELPGVQQRMLCQADCMVEKTSSSTSGGRLMLRAYVRCYARVLSQQPVEALSGIAGCEGLETRMQDVQCRRTVATGSSETMLREEFDLPAPLNVKDTLFATAQVQQVDVTGGQGRAGVTGTLLMDVCHAGGNPAQPIVTTQHAVPFMHTVELNGEAGDMLGARVTVKDVAVASQESADGERILRAEVQLGIQAWAEKEERLTLLCDAYTTKGDTLTLSQTTATCKAGSSMIRTAESGKVMIALPEGSPPMRSVVFCRAMPVAGSFEQTGGRLHAEGTLVITLIYMTDDSAQPVSVTTEAPFSAMFAATAGDDDLLLLHLSNVEAAAVTSDRAEVRYILHLTADGIQCREVTLITDAAPAAAEAAEDGIILTFAQPGDDLWKIAKRYRVPAARIRDVNPEMSDPPATGQGVIVWRKE